MTGILWLVLVLPYILLSLVRPIVVSREGKCSDGWGGLVIVGMAVGVRVLVNDFS